MPTGETARARAELERSLEIAPDHDDGRNALAVTALLERQPARVGG